MRLEANVSVREVGEAELPAYKIELKNINSFRFLEQAVTYEISRQSEALSAGKTLPQETRGWNPTENKSFVQRTKESAEDYRYFPDPDLPPIHFTTDYIEKIRSQLPLLPETILSNWKNNFNIDVRFGEPLTESQALAQTAEKLFIEAQSQDIEPNKVAGAIHNKKINFNDASTPSAVLQSFKALYATESVDTSELETIIQAVIEKNPDAVEKYKAGQTQIVGFFMGQIMRQLKVKANPQQVATTLGKALENC
jgi:aspartyl-tRNA(Asn)/glutamyl-tRNA(Gln) amidotransferase subunit B